MEYGGYLVPIVVLVLAVVARAILGRRRHAHRGGSPFVGPDDPLMGVTAMLALLLGPLLDDVQPA